MAVQALRTIRQAWETWIAKGLSLALLVSVGCSVERTDKPSASASEPALYGAPLGTPSPSIPRLHPMAPQSNDWRRAPFACVQTELSPATLYHATTKRLSFFTRLAEYGLGAPAYAAFNTPTGPKIHKNGEPMDAKWMEENWVLVWFAGASGWTNWDSPWVVYLQHKPKAIALDPGGLHFDFNDAAGDVVLFPLYGYDKAAPAGRDFLAAHGLPSNKIRTWEWVRAIPRDPLMRVKYWACATREFPIYCEDSFSVNRAKDTVTIRQRFQWHSIDDDWKTRHIKLHPISPSLGLASMDKSFPVEFSKPVRDFALATPYGPYLAAENVDSLDATFKVLQYINETEAYDTPQATNHPTVPAALNRLRQTANEKFHGGAIEAGIPNLWYTKALPYLEETNRTNALVRLRKYFHEELFGANGIKMQDFPNHTGFLETLWSYAHFSGDWDLIKEHWPQIKVQFNAPAEMRWVGFGRDFVTELGDQAAPCLALARMAYKVGDLDTYDYACYLFARELTHHYVKQRGAAYFRQHQPWHSMEFMDEEVYVTSLAGDVAGWQIDGPNYPAAASENRQYTRRWVRFNNEDVGRFYRDYLKEDVRHELDRLSRRSESAHKFENTPDGLPSQIQLRSLLLNETPAELGRMATPEQFTGSASGLIASCIAVLRTSHPTRYQRLIPAGEPSPFVAGLEREVAGPNPFLMQALQSSAQDESTRTTRPIWPEGTWWKSWQTPTGHRWTFGQITPEQKGAPVNVRTVRLNWNTEAIIVESLNR